MSAIYGGYDTNYSAIADIHDRSHLTYSKESRELEFMSSITPETSLTWEEYMKWILYQQKGISPKLLENAINKDLKDKACSAASGLYGQNSGYGIQPTIVPSVGKAELHTVYDVVRNNPLTSKFADMIDKTTSSLFKYNKIHSLEFPVTLLAPINDEFDSVLYDGLNNYSQVLNAFQTLRYHVLPYVVKPEQMIGRKYRLTTDLEKEKIESDWTEGKRTFVSQMGLFTGDYMENPGEAQSYFPRDSWNIKVLDVIYCAGGIVYIISSPLRFNRAL